MNGTDLKKMRQSKGISQDGLAIGAKVAISRITKFECGYRDLTGGEKERLTKYLNSIPDKEKQGFWSRVEIEKEANNA